MDWHVSRALIGDHPCVVRTSKQQTQLGRLDPVKKFGNLRKLGPDSGSRKMSNYVNPLSFLRPCPPPWTCVIPHGCKNPSWPGSRGATGATSGWGSKTKGKAQPQNLNEEGHGNTLCVRQEGWKTITEYW